MKKIEVEIDFRIGRKSECLSAVFAELDRLGEDSIDRVWVSYHPDAGILFESLRSTPTGASEEFRTVRGSLSPSLVDKLLSE